MHILRVNCAKMVEDKLTQSAYEIFAIECRLQQSMSQPPTSKYVCTSGCQIDVLPLKSGYFSAIGLSIVNTAADRHRHVAYHNKHQ